MLDVAELLENSFAASARLLRRGTLRLLTLERRVKEATIKAIRSKRIDYVKYLNTIDKSTRIIVTENGRLGLAPTVSKLGDVCVYH
jgi:CII-binding regulator of phage lambda lysogenization HflD